MNRRKSREKQKLRVVRTGPFPYDWERIDERNDPSMHRQENEQRCTAACVLALVGGERPLTQTELAGGDYLSGEPAPIDKILPVLRQLDPNGAWALRIHGEPENFAYLAKNTPWLAILILSRPGMQFQGHSVIVQEMTAGGELLIKDPLQATQYWMRLAGFNARWNGMAFFRTRKITSRRRPKPI